MTFQELESLQGLNEAKSREYHRYFRAKRTPRNTSIMAPPELRGRYFTSQPYCRTACQVISERIEIDSVTADTQEATDFLNKVLKDLGGAEFVNTAVMAAMEYGRSYLVPTATDSQDQAVGVQVIPGKDMLHSLDPYTGEILEGLRVFGEKREGRVYYTRKKTVVMEKTGDGWTVTSTQEKPDGGITVFPVICREDVGSPWGRPEAKDIFTIQDSACRVATDMAIASATMATPLRAISGVEEDDFTVRNADGSVKTDSNGNPLRQTGTELYMSRMLLLSDPAAKLAEYTAAQLQNFTTALNFLTRSAASTMGVPQSVFGVASDANPASGEAIRQDDSRLIRRAEQLTRGFDPGFTALFDFLLADNGFAGQKAVIRWVDPSLPNQASRADSIAKLAAVTVDGRPLYNWEELRALSGDSGEQIKKAQETYEKDQLNRLVTTPDPGTANEQQPTSQRTTKPVPQASTGSG